MRHGMGIPCRTGITSSWNFNSSRFISWPAWRSPAGNGSRATPWRICLGTGCFIRLSKWNSLCSKPRQKLYESRVLLSENCTVLKWERDRFPAEEDAFFQNISDYWTDRLPNRPLVRLYLRCVRRILDAARENAHTVHGLLHSFPFNELETI